MGGDLTRNILCLQQTPQPAGHREGWSAWNSGEMSAVFEETPTVGIIDRAIANSVPLIPRPIVRRISRRYIAGERLEEAVEIIRVLNREGCVATVDVLGESTESEYDAVETLDQYKQVLDTLEDQGLDSGISVKLTGLGLDLDEDLCRRNLEEIIE